jgi:putative oxidoreductase
MNELIARLNLGRDAVTAVLRVVVGLLLAWHGYRKFADGLDGFEGFLSFLELPAPGLLSIVVAVLELVGGLLLAIGLLTRPVAALLVIQFALITVWVKLVKLDAVLLVGGDSPGIELDLIYLASALYFLVAGPGPFSVDSMIGVEPSVQRRDEVAIAT